MAKRMAKRLDSKTVKRRTNAGKKKTTSQINSLAFMWPRIKMGFSALSVVVVFSALLASAYYLINRPLQSIELQADLVRVNSLEIEKVLADYQNMKFLSVDLTVLKSQIESVGWVDRVEVQRRFPGKLFIQLTEHVAAARWGDSGLLNTRGELIVQNAQFLPPELPRLDGPQGTEWQVAQQYLELRGYVQKYGLRIKTFGMDARGAWQFRLSNGLEVKIGRDAIIQRFQRFARQVLPLLSQQSRSMAVVDMRYSNGFAVKWNSENDTSPATDGENYSEIQSGNSSQKITQKNTHTKIMRSGGDQYDV
ncbi:MAG: FtsQ-type POTRA domain-containing protein [Gammaproteobacteria bacterium]|nr:cell division protein FtsQ/DivIB [Gammaproteobacteria bacterium]NNC97334.1 FtsQ-type POTRA domain-containing protein [Gammaproteobacteria bacterium]NNM14926.1 FtsQ-type POTRA domain-containing protein [Gammaproteobacteria bacterium]